MWYNSHMNAQQTLHAVAMSSDVEIFIVGGYVRDRLLGRECKDHDFVVTGATPELMIECGFQRVGADFPVFLAENGDEFALARVERKTGEGYNGFDVAVEDVSLEDDLRRRDLTINAMARRVLSFNPLGHAKLDDEIIDPFSGQAHLAIGALVHVSDAFAEDPLRVLRVARFAARYGFDVGQDTLVMMQDIVNAGEMSTLTPERVWQEMSAAMLCDHPERFWQTLTDCDAFETMFPSVCSWRFVRNALLSQQVAPQPALRFAVLLHDQHTPFIRTFFEQLKAPTDVKRVAVKVSQLFQESNSLETTTAARMLHILNRVDALRRPDEFIEVLAPCMSVLDRRLWTWALEKALLIAQRVSFDTLTEQEQASLKGPEIKDRLTHHQIGLIDKLLINTQ